MAKDIEVLQKSKNESRPISKQLQAAERRVFNKNKALNAAKLAATVAAEAVREAQRELVKADEKVLDCQQQWQEAEQERQKLCQQPAPEASQDAPNVIDQAEMFERFAHVFGDDEEAARAMHVLRQKLSERSRAEVPAEVPAEMGLEIMAVDADILQLERQSAAAKRNADEAEDRVQQFKRNRTGMLNARDALYG